MNCKKVLFLSVLIFAIKQSAQTPVSSSQEDHVNIDVDLSCITNATCLTSVSNKVIRALKLKKSIDIGPISVTPLKNAQNEGRAVTKLWDIAGNNAINIPIGAYSLSVQKSDEYENYLEISVSKSAFEGRRRRFGGPGGKKQMQMFVPSFLVASQVGWWLLALAGVTLLSIKAFLVSKLALVIAGVMTFKKLFDHHHGIHPHPFYEHHEPLMVPLNFGYDGFSGPAAFPSDFHPSLPIGHEQTAALHANGALGAESSPQNVVSNATGASVSAPGLSAFATVVMTEVKEILQKKKEIKSLSFYKSSFLAWRILFIDFLNNEVVNNSNAKKYFNYIVYTAHCVNLLLYGISNLSCICRRPIEIEKLFLGISIMATMSIIVMRYSCIYWNSNKLRNVVDKLPTNYTEQDVKKFSVDKRLKGMKKFIGIYFFYMCTSYIFVIVGPFFIYMQTGNKIFPLAIEIPFDTNSIFVYLVVFFWIILSHTDHIILVIINDSILYGIINVIALEFSILKENFEDLKSIKDEVQFKVKLVTIIERQNELHEMVKNLQKIFSPSLFFNFIIVSFIMCFNAFQASTTNSFIEMIFAFMFGLSSTNQIFLQCYFGEKLKVASESVFCGIYNCGWENIENIKLRKCLILVLERAQKPATLKILDIADINMNQFENNLHGSGKKVLPFLIELVFEISGNVVLSIIFTWAVNLKSKAKELTKNATGSLSLRIKFCNHLQETLHKILFYLSI
ncbi:hypothetical protein PVAND_002072 [Polypedilum vanderplanki]|uniref:Odorant receptor n=1 Tax=Polypedilum vanderplanki TaxID=319348 RepID=A0A9J6BQ74_POLVA|nr:hypothetical protein PVAND_002072 [Polypedilum vanderplanki]